ncbi:MAG: HAD family phosphatase [bacterium]
MIDLIIFDLGNVILNFDHMIICKKLSKLSKFPLQEVYERIFSSGLERLYDEGKISTKDFFKEISNRFGLNISLTEFKLLWQDIFWVNEGIEEILLKLKGRYKLFLLSNTNELHFEFAKDKFDILNLIDEYILSYKVGFSKPSPEIFYEALKKAKVDASRCIYIDDIKEHVISANKVGMKGVLFKSIDGLKRNLAKYGVKLYSTPL